MNGKALDAVKNNNIEALHEALKNGADPIKPLIDYYGNNAFVQALRTNKFEMVEIMLPYLNKDKLLVYENMYPILEIESTRDMFLRHKTEEVKILIDLQLKWYKKLYKQFDKDNALHNSVIFFEKLRDDLNAS